MNTRRTIAATGVAALTGAAALMLAATPAAADQPITFDQARDELAGNVDDTVVSAMVRDFDLTIDQAYDRLAVETVATDVQTIAEDTFADAYAGTWLTGDASGIVVAVTDPALADDVAELGATATVVDQSLSELDGIVADLDTVDAPAEVHGWYSDATTNTVTIVAESRDAALDVAETAGVDADAIAVDIATERPQTMQGSIVGGTAYIINNSSRCSVGFSATHPSYGPGFYTAGHCGNVGASVTSGTGAPGTFRYSVFPGSDYAWVEAGSGWSASSSVDGIGNVSGTSQAPIGSSICRSGSTTGTHCGTVQAFNQTVNYAQGTVYGMTRTSVCAEPGDSGGAYVSGGNAQGMTSGGSGNCSSGGTTFFFPIGDAMSAVGAPVTTS